MIIVFSNEDLNRFKVDIAKGNATTVSIPMEKQVALAQHLLLDSETRDKRSLIGIGDGNYVFAGEYLQALRDFIVKNSG